jgi:hypothetical protein
MVPRALFSKAKKTMIVILLITFLSGGNYFVLLLFWPTQVYNVYGKCSSFSDHIPAHDFQAMIQSASVSDLCPSASVSSAVPLSA